MRFVTILAVFALTTFSFLSSCDITLAKDAAETEVDELISTITDPGAVDIGESVIGPDSPIYFLKSLREKLELLASGTNEDQVNRQLEFAQRRLREVKALVKSKKQHLIVGTMARYYANMAQAENLASGDELKIKVVENVARHLDVLQRVYDQVGNPEAKSAIRAAIERSEEHNRLLIAKLGLIEQQKLIKKIAVRQAFACKFLMREATSSGLNDTEKSVINEKVRACREDVRMMLQDELRSLINRVRIQE